MLLAAGVAARAQSTNGPAPIDLPTVLRLAGAQSLDVQLARERLAEARAIHGGAVAQFFPTFTPGISYRRHDNNIQDVAGNVIEVHKQSYAPGATLGAQVDLGEAWYKQLAAKQLARAAGHALEAQQQESVAGAAQSYFDLLGANAALSVAAEAVNISSNYAAEVEQAVAAGIAQKAEQSRARVQVERNALALQRAEAERRVTAARLAQALHLDSSVDLLPSGADLVPLPLARTNLAALTARAYERRPELKHSAALISSAREQQKGATYGPLVPTVGAQVFVGGLGGGKNDAWNRFDHQEDYAVGVFWRIGPGGLFDLDRRNAADARLRIARSGDEKLRDQIAREVVEAHTRVESLDGQIATARRGVAAAEEVLRLARQRKEFGVAAVLETIQAEQELTRARLDYLRGIAEFNKARFALDRAVGEP